MNSAFHLILRAPILVGRYFKKGEIPASGKDPISFLPRILGLTLVLLFWLSTWSLRVGFWPEQVLNRLLLRTQTPVLLYYVIFALFLGITLLLIKKRQILTIWLRSISYSWGLLAWIHLPLIVWFTWDPLNCQYRFDLPGVFFVSSTPEIHNRVEAFLDETFEWAFLIYPIAQIAVGIVLPLVMTYSAGKKAGLWKFRSDSIKSFEVDVQTTS